MVKAFRNMNTAKRGRKAVTKDVTLKDFSGGLYPTDAETVLAHKYAPVLNNMTIEDDFSLVTRFGTKEFATCSAAIVAITYFEGAIIAFLADGTVEKVDSAGTVTAIWNTTIAAALPGAPSAWSATTHIDFAEGNGGLAAFNDVDKPILIDDTHNVTYLQDPATGSNTNTPIAQHVTVCNNYCVVANVHSVDDLTLVISSAGTTGVWPGDAAPNDSVVFELHNYISDGDTTVVGLSSFGNYLIVFLDTSFIVMTLGEYNSGGAHVPRVVNTVPETSIMGHRNLVKTDKDILFMGKNGVFSARQATFTEAFETQSKSDNIAKLLSKVLPTVPNTTTINSFAVQDAIKDKAFFFLEDSDSNMHVYQMSYTKDLKTIQWNTISGWSFTSGCKSAHKRIFLSEGTKIYRYGNDVFADEEYYEDYLDTNGDNGTPIDIDWELPWTDFGNRMKTKQMLRIAADTLGTARFKLQVFVDKIYKDAVGAYNPSLEIEMVGGDTQGFGGGGVTFGSGRNVSDERQYGMPVRFKVLKLRFTGSVTEKLLITSISYILNLGTYHR